MPCLSDLYLKVKLCFDSSGLLLITTWVRIHISSSTQDIIDIILFCDKVIHRTHFVLYYGMIIPYFTYLFHIKLQTLSASVANNMFHVCKSGASIMIAFPSYNHMSQPDIILHKIIQNIQEMNVQVYNFQ